MTKVIFAEADNKCAVCLGGDITILEIHHIRSRESNEAENLIAVCPNCHTQITKGFITEQEVINIKNRLRTARPRSPQGSNVIQFNRSINNGLVTNNLTIKTTNKTVKLNPPNGTIASDLYKRNYIKYLIDRYAEFKKADRSITEYKYGLIYGAIKKQFGCKWDYIPTHKFSTLAEYLQKRIDNTILGKFQLKQGKKRYRIFEEFLRDLS